MKKYLGEIESINFLINYLKGFKEEENRQEEEDKKEVKVNQAEIAAKLNADGQWKKEKGLEVLQSKKSKEEEEPDKKYKKKNKKKAEPKKEEKFQIPFNVETMFEKLGLLAPSSPE